MRTSILTDREAARSLEWNVRNGVVSGSRAQIRQTWAEINAEYMRLMASSAACSLVRRSENTPLVGAYVEIEIIATPDQ